MPPVEIEIDSPTNSNLAWTPTGETLRGRFDPLKVNVASAGDLAMRLKSPLPGTRIKIDPDKQTATICEPLAGPEHKATRDSLKAHGFRFAAGGHKLPSGIISHWGHSCERPKVFTCATSAPTRPVSVMAAPRCSPT